MILPKIALRNLSRQKKRSILLGGALAFGMLILVAVSGFTGGLIINIQKNFASLIAGHIYFMQFEKGEKNHLLNIVKDDKALMAALDTIDIPYTDISRRTMLNGTVVFAGESMTRAITGIDWSQDKSLIRDLVFLAGNAQTMQASDGILISTNMAAGLGLLPKPTMTYKEKHDLRMKLQSENKTKGKDFNLDQAVDSEVKKIEQKRKDSQKALAPQAIGEEVLIELKTIYGQSNAESFRVAGIYEAQFDIAAFVDRDRLNTLADMPTGSYNLFGLTLKDFSNLELKTMLLYNAIKDKYHVYPMEKVMGKSSNVLMSEIGKEEFTGPMTVVTNINNEMGSLIGVLLGVQIGSFGLFLVVLAVIMVGLVNTFRMVIYERTKEIGTMRAVGTQRNQVRRLFLLEALFLSLMGTIPGALLGLGVLGALRLMEFSSISEIGLFLDNGRIGVSLDPTMVIASFSMVIIFTLVAALLPANRAAKLEPAQALRTQF